MVLTFVIGSQVELSMEFSPECVAVTDEEEQVFASVACKSLEVDICFCNVPPLTKVFSGLRLILGVC